MSDNTIANRIQDTIVNIKKLDNFSELIIYFICFIIISLIIVWLLNIYTLDNRNCNYMNQLYINRPTLGNVIDKYNQDESNASELSINDKSNFRYKLFDYYIKTAYNSCCAGNYKNDFVNLCALKNCITQGVRCLDMQIYSLNDEPVIATASFDNNTTKETYNSLPLSSVLNTIYDHAFSQLYCPNWKDPLILHFRIMSNNKTIYNKIAKLLKHNLKDKLLSSKYSYENRNLNLGQEKLIDFVDKIIISVDKSNKTFIDTKLHEFINISSHSFYKRLLRYTNDVKFTPDMNELIEYNKTNMSLCLPDLGNVNINPDFDITNKFGVQLTAMAFQNNDTNLNVYNNEFTENNYAFILKHSDLRYVQETMSVEKIERKLYLSSKKQTNIQVGLGNTKSIII
jgi:hypothetical protein